MELGKTTLEPTRNFEVANDLPAILIILQDVDVDVEA